MISFHIFYLIEFVFDCLFVFVFSGLVHCDVRVGHLPPEPVACIPDAEDRSDNVRDRGGGRRRNGVAHKTVRRVPSIHQEAARYFI